jgi:TolB-like protein
MQGTSGFFAELQRRHVIRAAAAHVIAFWLLLQIADVVLPYVGIVEDPVRWALLTGVALFPVTVVIAWFFEHPWQRYTRSRVAIDAIVILVVIVTAGSWVMRNLPQVVHTRTSIVILPFEHSDNPIEKTWSRALAHEVNSLLMRSKSIDVIGFESATSSKLDGLTIPRIAETLNVEHLLTGDLNASGESMRISIRLLDAAGEALWSTVIDEAFENLYALQERIATEIEARLGSADGAIPVAQIASERCWMPSDPEALVKYYTARHFIELRTDSDESRRQIREAIESYKELIETYPNFAEAYAGLAWAYGHQAAYDPGNAIPDWQENSAGIARQAVEYCPTLTEAIHHLPNQYDDPNPWIGDFQQLTAFIELEPERMENYQRLSRHYQESGHVQRAIEVAERIYTLDPLSVRAIKNLGSIYIQAGRIGEAEELFDIAAELGNTGPNWGRENNRCRTETGIDLECRLRNLPPPFVPFAERLREIYTPPADDADQRAKIDLAMSLHRERPGQWVNWLNHSACNFDHLTSLFFEIWEQNQDPESQGYWFWPNVWNAQCGNVWADPRFPGWAAEVMLVDYWRVAGWPPMCREQGTEVVCGESTPQAHK